MSNLYHYTGSALPNVYLESGYEQKQTPYGTGVTIHDLEGLHAALGRAIIANPAPLTGAEFRFLRQELELSQAALGAMVGRDEQSVARWEKGRTSKVDPAADRLLRIVYQQSRMGDKPLAPALEFLQHLESRPPLSKDLIARTKGRRWQTVSPA
jgi:DNA-binding transcriptional regulator YiaG